MYPLELYRRGAKEPFFIWVWECKDYEGLISVDDIEEFHAKLEQIGLHRTKGTVTCRIGFQKSAVKSAEAKGIGLVRALPDGSLIRLAEAVKTISKDRVEFGLTEPDTLKLDSMCYRISTSGRGVEWFEDLVFEEMNANKGVAY